jgi:hypothetical protein
MVNVTLTWEPYYLCSLAQTSYPGVSDIAWNRYDDKSIIPPFAGLYVIEDGAGDLVYIGQADNWFNRFAKRNRVLREFRLAYKSTPNTNPISAYKVRLASVMPIRALTLTESCLIRTSWLKQNAAKANPSDIFLQNINQTTQLTIPDGGLSIVHANNNYIPDYLETKYGPWNAGTKI